VALTAEGIKNIKPGKARREIADGEQLGLYLVVQPSGFKSFVARFRVDGEPVKLTLGDIYTISLEEARERTREARKQVRGSLDPRKVRKEAEEAAKKAATVEEKASMSYLWNDYMDKFSNKKRGNEKRTLQEKERLWRKELQPRFGERAAKTITRREIIDMIDDIVDRGAPIWANRVLSMTNTYFTWLLGRDEIPFVPGHKVPVPSEEEDRERVLTNRETRLFWMACLKLGYPFGAMGRLLLLTGTRLRESAQAERSEFTSNDMDGAVWHIPGQRTKNGEALEVFLPPTAVELLQSLPAIQTTDESGRTRLSRYVLTTTGDTPISGFSKAKTAIKREMLAIARAEAEERGEDPKDVVLADDWRFHDLRRTVSTRLNALGVLPHVAEAVLNYQEIIKGVSKTYNRHDYRKEKKAALLLWSDHLASIISGVEDTKVVPLLGNNVLTIEGGRKGTRKAKAG
jgi:integrase